MFFVHLLRVMLVIHLILKFCVTLVRKKCDEKMSIYSFIADGGKNASILDINIMMISANQMSIRLLLVFYIH